MPNGAPSIAPYIVDIAINDINPSSISGLDRVGALLIKAYNEITVPAIVPVSPAVAIPAAALFMN
jgi:hypothetical protein